MKTVVIPENLEFPRVSNRTKNWKNNNRKTQQCKLLEFTWTLFCDSIFRGWNRSQRFNLTSFGVFWRVRVFVYDDMLGENKPINWNWRGFEPYKITKSFINDLMKKCLLKLHDIIPQLSPDPVLFPSDVFLRFDLRRKKANLEFSEHFFV